MAARARHEKVYQVKCTPHANTLKRPLFRKAGKPRVLSASPAVFKQDLAEGVLGALSTRGGLDKPRFLGLSHFQS